MLTREILQKLRDSVSVKSIRNFLTAHNSKEVLAHVNLSEISTIIAETNNEIIGLYTGTEDLSIEDIRLPKIKMLAEIEATALVFISAFREVDWRVEVDGSYIKEAAGCVRGNFYAYLYKAAAPARGIWKRNYLYPDKDEEGVNYSSHKPTRDSRYGKAVKIL